jgi:predicted acyltransferase
VSRPPKAAGPAARVLSVDLLRGLDVLLMLFVNEMAGVRGTPAFLLHEPATADGMTLTDVVFPAFLFITGMAIPLALGGRLRRGEPRPRVWRHVLTRTAVLLALGVLMVNAEHASETGILSPALWNVLMTVAAVVLWSAPPEGTSSRARMLVRAGGAALLVVVALLYRADGMSGLVQLRPHWWGILGLIGWAYLVASVVYLLAGDRPAVLAGAVALLYCLFLADEAGRIGWLLALQPFLRVGRVLGSHGALVLSGTVLTVMLLRHRDDDEGPLPVAHALGYGAALATAGLLLHALHGLHPAFWINKVKATAAWCLLSAAFTIAAWAVVYVLADLRGWRRWGKAIPMAGENALVAYLLAPLALSVFALAEPLFGGINPYQAVRQPFWAGTLCSVVFAWLVVRLCGWMRARGLRVQL